MTPSPGYDQADDRQLVFRAGACAGISSSVAIHLPSTAAQESTNRDPERDPDQEAGNDVAAQRILHESGSPSAFAVIPSPPDLSSKAAFVESDFLSPS